MISLLYHPNNAARSCAFASDFNRDTFYTQSYRN
jgi:hypothetical protein